MPFENIRPADINDMALAQLSSRDPTKKDFFSTSLPRLLSGAGGGFGFGEGTSGGGFGFDGGGGPTFGGLSSSDMMNFAQMLGTQNQSVSPFDSQARTQAFTSGGGGDVPGSITGGPGPVSGQGMLDAAVAAAVQGQDPNVSLESGTAQNQADINITGMANSILSGGRNINSFLGLLGGLLGQNMSLALGPAAVPIMATQAAMKLLNQRATRENEFANQRAKQQVQMAEANVPAGRGTVQVSGSEPEAGLGGAVGGDAPGAAPGAAPAAPAPTGFEGALSFSGTATPDPGVPGVGGSAVGAGLGDPTGTVGVGMSSGADAAAAAAGGAIGGIGVGVPGDAASAASDAAAAAAAGEAGDGGGGGAGGGAGGTVICTAYMQMGYLNRKAWYACSMSGLSQDEATMRGYRRWAEPLAVWLRSHPGFARAMWPVVRWWAGELVGKHPRIIMRVAVPICRWLGG